MFGASTAVEAPNIKQRLSCIPKVNVWNLPTHRSSDSRGQQHHTSSSPSRRRVPFSRTRPSCSPPRSPCRPGTPRRRTGGPATSSSCRRSARTCRGTRSGCLLLACGSFKRALHGYHARVEAFWCLRWPRWYFLIRRVFRSPGENMTHVSVTCLDLRA